MDDLFTYTAGKTDTSVEARLSIDATTLRGRVLKAIAAAGANGLTSNEIAAQLAVDYSAVQPRTSELRQLGAIEDSGDRRLNAKGKRVIVWRVAG